MTEAIDLTSRLADAEARLEELRDAQGEAVLDGVDFDTTELDALESEIAGLRSAQGAGARRDRQKEAELSAARKRELRDNVADLVKRRSAALTEAEAHCRGLMTALSDCLGTNEALAKAVHELTGQAAPTPLHGREFETRLSCRMGAVMGDVPGRKHRLGYLEWRGAFYRPDDDWSLSEGAMLKAHIAPILEQGKAGK